MCLSIEPRIVWLLGVFSCVTQFARAITYPESKRIAVTDSYFGTKIKEPYRWLEDIESSDTRAWIDAQNNLSGKLLKELPERDVAQAKLTELWNYARYGLPLKQGGHYLYTKNEGLQNQPVLYVQDSLQGRPRVLVDPHEISRDGTVALTTIAPSYDGQWLAYGLATAGS